MREKFNVSFSFTFHIPHGHISMQSVLIEFVSLVEEHDDIERNPFCYAIVKLFSVYLLG